MTHYPVIVDPSHAAGVWDLVTPLAQAGVAAGASGLIVEIHDDPEHAFSDGPQALAGYFQGNGTSLRRDSQSRFSLEMRCLNAKRCGRYQSQII